jgi:hypothetical protein
VYTAVDDGTTEERAMRRKLLAFLLALLLGFGGLTACGGDAENENVPGQSEDGEGEEDD